MGLCHTSQVLSHAKLLDAHFFVKTHPFLFWGETLPPPLFFFFFVYHIWRHEQKAKRAWSNHMFKERIKHKMYTNKNTLQTNNNNTQDMPPKTKSFVFRYPNWFLSISKMFNGFALFYSFVQRILKSRSIISYCTVRKHFLCFINTLILGISCWVIIVSVCLNMFSKICWKDWVMFIHKYRYTEIELKSIVYINKSTLYLENGGPVWLL